MKKVFENIWVGALVGFWSILLAATIVVCFTSRFAPETSMIQTVNPTTSIAETVVESEFDTSILNTTCAESLDHGNVRMVGAWVHERVGNEWELHDEQGNAWVVEDLDNMDSHGYLLLWIADNHTEQVEDDVIVKTWVEVY